MTTGSRDVLVAVVDCGVDYNHPDLIANMWTNPFETPGDGIDNDGNGYVDDIHGINTITTPETRWRIHLGLRVITGRTWRASLSPRPFSEVTVGVAWEVGIVAIRLVDTADTLKTSDAVQAFQYLNYLKNVQHQNIVAANSSWTVEPT